MSINERIKIALVDRNQTQSDLAKHMGYDLPSGQTRISHHLRGEDTDSIKLVTAVSELTGYSLPWLLTGNEWLGGFFPGGSVLTREESAEDEDFDENPGDIAALKKFAYLMQERVSKIEQANKEFAKILRIDTRKDLSTLSQLDAETWVENMKTLEKSFLKRKSTPGRTIKKTK